MEKVQTERLSSKTSTITVREGGVFISVIFLSKVSGLAALVKLQII